MSFDIREWEEWARGYIAKQDAEIARLTKLRALDEQQFWRLKASFDEVVRQRDEYRVRVALLESALEEACRDIDKPWATNEHYEAEAKKWKEAGGDGM